MAKEEATTETEYEMIVSEMQKHPYAAPGTSRAKKEATTAAQFELLVSEMKKYPDVARGTCNSGRSKVRADRVWYATSKVLNEVGPPIRTPSKWRKTWTDLRGRLRKKLSNNKSSAPITGGQPSEYFELTPIEQTIDTIVNGSATNNPSDNMHEQALSPPPYEESDSLSSECFHEPQMFAPIQSTLIEDGSELYDIRTPVKIKLSSKKHTSNIKKRRRDLKSEERKKLIKLTEKQTKEMSKITVALGTLTAAIEAQTRMLEQKLK